MMLGRVKQLDHTVVERKGTSPSTQTVSKSRPSSDPSAPLMDDATLCKKLTLLSLPRLAFHLHFNAFASAWEFCPEPFKIQNSNEEQYDRRKTERRHASGESIRFECHRRWSASSLSRSLLYHPNLTDGQRRTTRTRRMHRATHSGKGRLVIRAA